MLDKELIQTPVPRRRGKHGMATNATLQRKLLTGDQREILPQYGAV